MHLHAYETRVFLEMRELHDGAGLWRRLAERLGGRGVPSLEEELRYQQLGPVHDAVRAAIVDWSRDGEPGMDAAARVVNAVADATGTAGDRDAVVDRILACYAAALRVADEIDDQSETAALLVWSLLAPLGTLPYGAMVGPTSRAWYEELRLAPVVADALRSRGLDEGAAWWAAERVHTLLDLPLPSMLGGPAKTLPLRLVDAWLAHPAVRPFIRVNAWEGVEWFHRESWDELLAWMERLEWILSPAGRPPVAPAEALGAGDGARRRRPMCPATAWTGCARPWGPSLRRDAEPEVPAEPGGRPEPVPEAIRAEPSRGRARARGRRRARRRQRTTGVAEEHEGSQGRQEGHEVHEARPRARSRGSPGRPASRGRNADSPPGRIGGAIEEVGPDSGRIAADLLDREPGLTPGCVRTGR